MKNFGTFRRPGSITLFYPLMTDNPCRPTKSKLREIPLKRKLFFLYHNFLWLKFDKMVKAKVWGYFMKNSCTWTIFFHGIIVWKNVQGVLILALGCAWFFFPFIFSWSLLSIRETRLFDLYVILSASYINKQLILEESSVNLDRTVQNNPFLNFTKEFGLERFKKIVVTG